MTKKIALHIPAIIEPNPSNQQTVLSTAAINTASPQLPVVGTGRASISAPVEDEEGGEERDEEEEAMKFISSEQLARNRLSKQGNLSPSSLLLTSFSPQRCRTWQC